MLLSVLLLLAPVDSLRLEEVTVSGRRPPVSYQTVVLEEEALRRGSSDGTLAGALGRLPGVNLKDYGGVGGLKTIDVRALGASHTGVALDGVPFTDSQAGQPDLGRLSLSEIGCAEVATGLGHSALPSATELCQAATVFLTSLAKPSPAGGVSLTGGSFGLLRGAGWTSLPIGGRATIGLRGELTRSLGNYPYRLLATGPTQVDTTARRQNGDIYERRALLELRGPEWHMSLRRSASERGVPGAVVAGQSGNGQRRRDDHWWLQARRAWQLGYNWQLIVRGRLTHRFDRYHDLDKSHWTFDAVYRQRALYTGLTSLWGRCVGAHQVHLTATCAYDLLLTGLQSDRGNVGHRRRLEHRLGLRLGCQGVRFGGRAQVAATLAGKWRGLCAGIEATVPHLLIYAKRTLRLPTYTEQYYGQTGVPGLRPELAWQTGVSSGGQCGAVSLSAEAYAARVTDKLVAWPTGQLYRWTMLNVGRVGVVGGSVRVHYEGAVGKVGLLSNGQYTAERSLAAGAGQVAYVPLHSAAADLSVTYRGLELSVQTQLVGERWTANVNRADNRLPPWHTLDAALRYHRALPRGSLAAALALNNLTGHNYEVVRNYPMPGRNLNITLSFDL